MKNRTQTIVTGALVCSIFTVGCLKKEPISPETTNVRVELKAGLSAITIPANKASIETGTTFTASIAGWQTAQNTADYSQAHTWHSTAEISASASPEAVTLSPEQFYDEVPATKTYMKAWFPQGAPATSGLVTFTEAHNPKDGSVDVLFANEIWATSAIAPSAVLQFKHMLSQLRFEVISDANYDKIDNKVETITVESVELPVGLNLTDNTVSYQTTADQLVPGVNAAGVAISTTATAVGDPMMIRPFTTNNFKVDIKTSQLTYNDVTVTIKGETTFIAGKSYLIKLRFIGSAIAVESTVDEWVEGPLGNGIVK